MVMRNRIASGLAGLSLLLAVGAFAYLFFEPGEEETTIEQLEGVGLLVVLIFPITLCAAGFLVSLRPSAATRPVMWVISMIVSVYALVSVYTTGFYYLPAALLVIIASIAAESIPENGRST